MDPVSLRSSLDSGELRLGPVRYGGDAAWYRASLRGPVVSGSVEVHDRAPVRLTRFLRELGEKGGWMVSGILELEAAQLAEIAGAADRLFAAAPPDHGTIVTWPGPRSG